MLSEGVKQIEKESEGALLASTGDGLRRPEPITIREHVILARLDVGELNPSSTRVRVCGSSIGGGRDFSSAGCRHGVGSRARGARRPLR